MKVSCLDCRHYLRGDAATPPHPGYAACKKSAMVADLSGRGLTAGSIIDDPTGPRWLAWEIAPLNDHYCDEFKLRGQPHFDPRGSYEDWTDVPEILDSSEDSTEVLTGEEIAAINSTESGESEESGETDESDPDLARLLKACWSESTPDRPWSEPTSSDPESLAANRSRKARAERLAEGQPRWTCPHCQKDWPAVTLAGRPRKGCPSLKCARKQQGAISHARGSYRQLTIPWTTVQTIRATYQPGVVGYRQLAKEHHVDPTTVRDIVLFRTRKED